MDNTKKEISITKEEFSIDKSDIQVFGNGLAISEEMKRKISAFWNDLLYYYSKSYSYKILKCLNLSLELTKEKVQTSSKKLLLSADECEQIQEALDKNDCFCQCSSNEGKTFNKYIDFLNISCFNLKNNYLLLSVVFIYEYDKSIVEDTIYFLNNYFKPSPIPIYLLKDDIDECIYDEGIRPHLVNKIDRIKTKKYFCYAVFDEKVRESWRKWIDESFLIRKNDEENPDNSLSNEIMDNYENHFNHIKEKAFQEIKNSFRHRDAVYFALKYKIRLSDVVNLFIWFKTQNPYEFKLFKSIYDRPSKEKKMQMFKTNPWGIKNDKSDYLMCRFNGEIMKSSSAVNSILEYYLFKNPFTDYEMLKKLFPDFVFKKYSEISRYELEKYRKNPIVLKDGNKIAVNKTWSVHRFNEFISIAKGLGLEIEPIVSDNNTNEENNIQLSENLLKYKKWLIEKTGNPLNIVNYAVYSIDSRLKDYEMQNNSHVDASISDFQSNIDLVKSMIDFYDSENIENSSTIKLILERYLSFLKNDVMSVKILHNIIEKSESVELEFHPKDKNVFLLSFSLGKQVRRTFFYKNKNETVTDIWNARNISMNSDLFATIHGASYYREGRKNGLYKIKFEVIGFESFENSSFEEVKNIFKQSNNAEAQNFLGDLYFKGKKTNYVEAFDWYAKAAEQGNSNAQFSLGVMYENGRGVKENYTRAIEWYEKAAEQGNVKAQYTLGSIYLWGFKIEPDYEKAFKWLKKAAEQGDIFSQYELGDMYYKGFIIQDYEKAFEYYKKVTEQGIVNDRIRPMCMNNCEQFVAIINSINRLGIMYYYGLGVEQNYKKAFEWIEKALKQDNPYSSNGICFPIVHYLLGDMYYFGQGIKQNYTKAFEYFEKAANQGYREAQYSLGYMYENGEGIEQDYESAFNWYKESVRQGNVDAQKKLLDMYQHGIIAKQDYEKAFDCFENYATGDGCEDVDVHCRLGDIYSYGEGVKQDYEKAMSWYEDAAEQGYAKAQYALGNMYYYGKGVEKDYDLADYWLENAADQGYVKAQYKLGVMYENGEGIEKDYVKAVELYKKAAEQENEKAIEALKRLKK